MEKEGKVYGYVRVSTNEQNVDRQIAAMQDIGLTEKQIFIDKMSGKNFDRPAYQHLRKQLHEGDLLYIQSLDRLGRSYEDMIEEWRFLTKTKKVDICVIDMPLLNTQREKDLLGTFVSDLVLQILSFFAEMERKMIKERQAQGIRAAKEKGVKFGRPRVVEPEGFDEAVARYLSKELTLKDAANEAGMCITTFYHHALIKNER